MTLGPVEEARVTIPAQDGWVDEPQEQACCNPECDRRGTQTHHVVRRSATAGAKRWVAVDGVVLLNERRVCAWCHEDLNNHNAWVRHFTGQGWVWYAAVPGQHSLGPDLIQHPKSGRYFRRVGTLKRG